MAYEQFRIYGYNHGNETEHYRLHVRDRRTGYEEQGYGNYRSRTGGEYIDRPQQSRPEHYTAPYTGSTRKSRRGSRHYSNDDYISPPTEDRNDYISPNYDTVSRRTSRHRNGPGGFYEDEGDAPAWPNVSAQEQDSIHRLMKEAKFGNEHEVMRAYWVPGPQDYDELEPPRRIDARKVRPRSRSRSERRKVEYGSDVQTYVDDSGEERGGAWDSAEDDTRASRDRWRSKPRAEHSRMPGGYASSPSPSIHYESDEEEYTPSRCRRYASSSPPRSIHRSRRDSSASPAVHRYASSSPTRSDWGEQKSPIRRRHVSFSPTISHPRHRSSSPPTRTRHTSSSPHPRIHTAPSPPPAIRRYSSPSPDSDYEVPVRYNSDTDGEEDSYISGSERGRYIRSDVNADSDVCSDFVINGGSECEFEGDDIWCVSGSEEEGEGDED
jgi:hypothetical protein